MHMYILYIYYIYIYIYINININIKIGLLYIRVCIIACMRVSICVCMHARALFLSRKQSAYDSSTQIDLHVPVLKHHHGTAGTVSRIHEGQPYSLDLQAAC